MDADIDTPSTEDQLGGGLKGRPQSGAWGVKKSNGLNLPKATASSRTAGRKMRGVLSEPSPQTQPHVEVNTAHSEDKICHRCCPPSPPGVSVGHVTSVLA